MADPPPQAPIPADPSAHLDAELSVDLIGGLEPVVVRVVDYDPRRVRRFERGRTRFGQAPGPLAHSIQRLGSTGVPGLASKPVIDILVEVDDPDPEDLFRLRLEEAGYHLRVRERCHRMFRRAPAPVAMSSYLKAPAAAPQLGRVP